MKLARHHQQGAIKIREIVYEEGRPEKFLELILLKLKNARLVESVRGAKGGHQLQQNPGEIALGEVIRFIDGPLAPFVDSDQLRELIERDPPQRALYQVFLDVRDAAARILDHTTLADLLATDIRPRKAAKAKSPKRGSAGVLPMVVGGHKGD